MKIIISKRGNCVDSHMYKFSNIKNYDEKLIRSIDFQIKLSYGLEIPDSGIDGWV